MFEIKGAYNNAICYSSTVEDKAIDQIKSVCDNPAFQGSKIRIMPDVHAGKGCTIGTTMTITDKIVPNMVGVDIGCGMETVKIAEKNIDLAKLDDIIHRQIPCGMQVRSIAHDFSRNADIAKLRCAAHTDFDRAVKSIGTLGGGNHFIEVNQGQNGELYVVVHSGSRHLGCEVAEYYQNQGLFELNQTVNKKVLALVEQLKSQGRFAEISTEIVALKNELNKEISRFPAYVEGQLFADYIHDMKIVQHFAELNRKAMTQIIIDGMNLTEISRFTTIHNYIDTERMILRKGSVSAQSGEILLIPINMRDGSLICTGKGNEDWNCSAPHGAGRLMSRKAATETLSMDEYKTAMDGIYTSCVTLATLDESPMAYKSMAEIIENIEPTVEILERIIPIYNFKAAE